jgi:hypothetical protein
LSYDPEEMNQPIHHPSKSKQKFDSPAKSIKASLGSITNYPGRVKVLVTVSKCDRRGQSRVPRWSSRQIHIRTLRLWGYDHKAIVTPRIVRFGWLMGSHFPASTSRAWTEVSQVANCPFKIQTA